MATREYVDFAVEQLAAYLEETLPTFVTAVNAQQADLTPPLALEQMKSYARGVHPFSVEELPRLELEFQEMDSAEPAGFKNDLWDITIGIIVVTGFKDADVVEGQRDLQRYITAITRCIQNDITLQTANGNKVIECEIESAATSGAVSEIGRLYGTAVVLTRVQIHEV